MLHVWVLDIRTLRLSACLCIYDCMTLCLSEQESVSERGEIETLCACMCVVCMHACVCVCGVHACVVCMYVCMCETSFVC